MITLIRNGLGAACDGSTCPSYPGYSPGTCDSSDPNCQACIFEASCVNVPSGTDLSSFSNAQLREMANEAGASITDLANYSSVNPQYGGGVVGEQQLLQNAANYAVWENPQTATSSQESVVGNIVAANLGIQPVTPNPAYYGGPSGSDLAQQAANGLVIGIGPTASVIGQNIVGSANYNPNPTPINIGPAPNGVYTGPGSPYYSSTPILTQTQSGIDTNLVQGVAPSSTPVSTNSFGTNTNSTSTPSSNVSTPTNQSLDSLINQYIPVDSTINSTLPSSVGSFLEGNLISGVPNYLLLAGVGVIGFFMLSSNSKRK
jgi:hypothetical protein